MVSSNITLVGDLKLSVYQDDILKDERVIKNMIVATGKNLTAALLAGGIVKPTHLALGTSSSPTSPTMTALGTPSGSRVAFNSASSVDNVATFITSIMPGTNTGAYAEAGIFTASTNGIMLCRTTFNTITKTAVDKLVITWNIRVN